VYAYTGIDSDPTDYPAVRNLQADPAITSPLAGLRTRLNEFSDEEQGRLINWGWYMTDIAVRSYIVDTATVPAYWPVPEWPLG
jgi:NTE family protein